MQTIPFSIQQVIDMARARQLVVPEFQRDFVWNEAQVRKLVDSVSRAYPVGSILLLRHSEQMGFKWRAISTFEDAPSSSGSDAPVGTPEEAERYYVLDGQQRVTSLVRVFGNAHPRNTYLVDLLQLFETFKEGSNGHADREFADWLRVRRTKNIHKKFETRQYLRTHQVLNVRTSSVLVDEFVDEAESLRDDRQQARAARAAIAQVFETIRNFKVPAVIMEPQLGVEAICRVFETINSTGTKLTTFDLATAKFYPTPNLRENWQTATEVLPVISQLEIDGERVLQVIALWVSHLEGRRSPPSRSELLALPAEKIKTHWDDATDAIAEACAWVMRRGAVTHKWLPSEAILVPMAAVMSPKFHQRAGLKPPAGFHDNLERWYWRVAFQRMFDLSTNDRIEKEFSRLLVVLRDDVLTFPAPLSLSVQDLIGTRADRDSRARAVLGFILNRKPADPFTGRDVDNRAEMESHHIFPRSKFKSERDAESIVNRVLVLKQTNRTIGAKEPYEYIPDLLKAAKKSGTADRLRERLGVQCIPVDAFDDAGTKDSGSFRAFLEARAKMLLDALVANVGQELILPVTSSLAEDTPPVEPEEEPEADDS